MTTTEATADRLPVAASRTVPRAPRGAVWSSARVRILAWYVALLALAVFGSLLLQRQILYQRLDQRITADLRQERDELANLIGGNVDGSGGRVEPGRDPETGEPFGGDVARVLEVFVQRNIPSDRETMFTFLNGEPFVRSAQEPLYRLDNDPRMQPLADLRDRTAQGEIETPQGLVRYLAVPVQPPPGSVGADRGVFVVAQFLSRERAEVDLGVRVAAGVGLTTLALASLAAWVAAGRILAPLRLLSDTAHSITESDLSQRIPVRGSDEVSALAVTFNGMLDRLETAFATQRSFIDDAGHELRTPITIVRGHLELLGDDPRERAETVALVTDELDRMNRMVDDLLMLARAFQPDFLQFRPVEVAALTKELHTKASALGQRDWRLDDVGSGMVVADRQRLTQAVMQLALNATQHTKPGAVIALGSAVGGAEARFWVRDTGPGIAEHEQRRVFERFARGSSGPRRSDGAGLGLAIVRAIAEGHGGRVQLRSHRGAGATFTIIVPAAPPADDEEEEAQQ